MEGKKLTKQQSKDPFEAAFEEEQQQQQQQQQHQDDDYDSPPASPAPPPPPLPNIISNSESIPNPPPEENDDGDDDNTVLPVVISGDPSSSSSLSAVPANSTAPSLPSSSRGAHKTHRDDNEEEEEEEHMEVELDKFPSSADPDKMAKMQAILSQFTEEQMSRYESFRRAGFQKSNMKRLLTSITGTQKISIPMTIVVSGIAKIFVGELVETARIVMSERKESGPVRPCHIREAYRRLKLEGKVPKRSVPRLFR
ncbi:Transcription initiation factor TFIID subunit 11 [Morus notabilis]|uniref:Transcription initiation factor TFIID subunit 11 n=1 Tax=Morus notabilis TaxID=981085 RepID=W9QX16_9ROSA|nr:transcription initiation factor TFIID subunit 11 [Morus notabilis]EXB56450.1 Transcription initiation factor TFIID subunit 11 [Morus notabilis]